jgi:hypothetical protein
MFYFVEHFAEWIRFAEAYGITARFRVEGCNDAGAAWLRIVEGHTKFPNEVWKLRVRLQAVK